MKPISALAAALAILAAIAFGPSPQAGAAEGGERYGTVSFPISCEPPAVKPFERAVAILYSFGYEEAEKAFAQVARIDPACAMAYWGIAMSLYQQLWEPHEVDSARAIDAVRKANELGARTQRERDYVATIAAFYADLGKVPYATRALAYSKAAEVLAQRYPGDREATIFYALSLIATAPPSDKTYANQRKAGAILEALFAKEPTHPGLAHYIIHSYDVPPLAEKALGAARKYAVIAPSSPHALHMPAHIFTRLGLWQEAIDSNLAAIEAGKAYSARALGDAIYSDTLHSMDYLEYAYLQTGRIKEAERVRDEMAAIRRVHPQNLPASYALTAVPARFALERGNWSEAAALTLPHTEIAWERAPWTQSTLDFAHAIGLARSGDPLAAADPVKKLAATRESLIASNQPYWAGQVEIERLEATAWIAHAQGKDDEALVLIRSAANAEDATEKSIVTPGSIIPAHEMAGDMLLELGSPAEALAEFEAALRTSPNRFHGLYGAAKAASSSGDLVKARAYYVTLLATSRGADPKSAELDEARRFVANR